MSSVASTSGVPAGFYVPPADVEENHVIRQTHQERSENSSFLTRLVNIFLLVTLVKPVHDVVKYILIDRKVLNLSSHNHLQSTDLSPLATARIEDMKERVHALARKVGISHPENIDVVVGNYNMKFGAVGSPNNAKVHLSPIALMEPEDLPEELKLEKLDQGILTEDQWVEQCHKWVFEKFTYNNLAAQTQLSIDRNKEFLRSQLYLLKKPEERNKVYESILGHEFGHIVHRHNLKTSLVSLAWQLLCIPTLFIPILFRNQVINYVGRLQEKEADLFSASSIPHDGLELGFKMFSEMHKKLYRLYPERYSADGEHLFDTVHPPIHERLEYLREFHLATPPA